MRFSRLIRWSWLLLGTALSLPGMAAVTDSSDALFNSPSILRLQLEIPAESIEQLRGNPRQKIPAIVRSGTNVWRQVGIHVKGSIGSFRTIDGKPSLTLNFDEFQSDQ